jgi:hypothetical protein
MRKSQLISFHDSRIKTPKQIFPSSKQSRIQSYADCIDDRIELEEDLFDFNKPSYETNLESKQESSLFTIARPLRQPSSKIHETYRSSQGTFNVPYVEVEFRNVNCHDHMSYSFLEMNEYKDQDTSIFKKRCEDYLIMKTGKIVGIDTIGLAFIKTLTSYRHFNLDMLSPSLFQFLEAKLGRNTAMGEPKASFWASQKSKNTLNDKVFNEDTLNMQPHGNPAQNIGQNLPNLTFTNPSSGFFSSQTGKSENSFFRSLKTNSSPDQVPGLQINKSTNFLKNKGLTPQQRTSQTNQSSTPIQNASIESSKTGSFFKKMPASTSPDIQLKFATNTHNIQQLTVSDCSDTQNYQNSGQIDHKNKGFFQNSNYDFSHKYYCCDLQSENVFENQSQCINSHNLVNDSMRNPFQISTDFKCSIFGGQRDPPSNLNCLSLFLNKTIDENNSFIFDHTRGILAPVSIRQPESNQLNHKFSVLRETDLCSSYHLGSLNLRQGSEFLHTSELISKISKSGLDELERKSESLEVPVQKDLIKFKHIEGIAKARINAPSGKRTLGDSSKLPILKPLSDNHASNVNKIYKNLNKNFPSVGKISFIAEKSAERAEGLLINERYDKE